MCECAKLDSDLLNFLLYKTKKKPNLSQQVENEILDKKWQFIVSLWFQNL